MATTGNPKPLGSYMWNGAKDIGKDIGSAAWNEAVKGMADIGNTFQAMLYGGWSTQASHHNAMRMSEEHSIHEDQKRIEPEKEFAKDGPAKE